MNLGQYISDLIRLANEAQKVSASTNDPLSLGTRSQGSGWIDSGMGIQRDGWKRTTMRNNEKSRRDESWSEAT